MAEWFPRFVLCLLAAIATAAAERSPADWLQEISAAYAKQESFIVTYTSSGENKSLEVTIGLEHKASLTVFHMIGIKNGRKDEIRQWNTPDDHFYLPGAAGVKRVDGVVEETRRLSKVLSAYMGFVAGEEKPPLIWQPHISLLLDRSTVDLDVGFSKTGETMWASALVGATVGRSDKETVTFSTKNHGLLTFDCATGLLTRQLVKGTQGEDRLLTARDVRLNPGKAEILRISSDWETEGDAYPSVMMTRTLRSSLFQGIVDGVDEGKMTPGRLAEFLDQERETLDQFAAACLLTLPGSLASKAEWKRMIELLKKDVRTTWLKRHPQQAGDEEAFHAFLADPRLREATRGQFVRKIDELEGMREQALQELFPDKNLPAGKTDDGKVAAKKIETTLVESYVSAILDRKMTEFWGRNR